MSFHLTLTRENCSLHAPESGGVYVETHVDGLPVRFFPSDTVLNAMDERFAAGKALALTGTAFGMCWGSGRDYRAMQIVGVTQFPAACDQRAHA